MNLRPTRSFIFYLCSVVIFSCSKDEDTFLNAVLVDDDRPVIVEDSSETTATDDTQNDEEDSVEFESRITIFPAVEDAYIQNGEGFDQAIVRLQENFRKSYLMFDLSQIDSIGGNITAVSLEFIVDVDDGSGTIKVSKGETNSWTENNLSENLAPKATTELGKIEQEYKIGAEVSLDLKIEELSPSLSTLILEHEEGDDLAFASKENMSVRGPKLIVTYDAPISSQAIVVADYQIIEESDEESAEEEENTEEDSTEEENTEEENTEEEEDTEEESTEEEEDTEEESTEEEEDTEEESTEEESTEEENTEDGDTTEEDTNDEEINTAPNVVAEATPLTGVVPLAVSFSSGKSSDDKGIAAYEWNFKNGNTASSASPTHTFTESGSYAVILKVTDAEGLESTDTITITVNEKDNEAPVAKAGANVVSGTAPLQVNFRGSDSTDDTSITKYLWDFKDNSSSSLANPSHTFNTPGTYVVELTVEDEKGLSNKDSTTITVNEPINEAPIAVATVNAVAGTTPLQVNFTGSNSTDDQGIESYLWDFKDGSTSDSANPSHTFVTAGVYNVDLVVYDAKGLSSSAVVTINVEEEIIQDNTSCSTDGGYAHETGLKTWCWGDVAIPSGTSTGRDGFSNGQLALNTECNGNMVKAEGDRLKFTVNPTSPAAQSWCSANYNYRSEIRTMPWNVDHPSGTEQWIGFNYEFGNTYRVDPTNNWIFYQSHEGTIGASPLLSLQIDGRTGSSYKMGEIVIVNASKDEAKNSIYSTNLVPKAGDAFDVVLHIIWGDENTGLLQVWLNGNKTLDIQTRTVRGSTGVGGNSKFGIYKHTWRGKSGVDSSAAQGVKDVETSMGPLRMITRKPGQTNYGQNSYSLVVPK